MAEISELSLLEIIGERRKKYELSFITTFNAYLPFYEQIVFRQLKNAGCRANVLLMDERQFLNSITDTHNRPKLAGLDYTLIPVNNRGGVFHPKILLLVGKENGLLCVGSHNMTFSGFGKNREMTVCFELGANKDSKKDLFTFQKVWRSLRQWSATQPPELLAAFDLAEQRADWLTEKIEPATKRDVSFFATAPSSDGASLWEQTRCQIPDSIRRATLIAPFFDDNLAFLEKITGDLNPKEFIVGIEPKTVVLSKDAVRLFPQIKFVETENLRQGAGYLHAKCLLIETDGGEEILIVGSANASSAAWLASGSCSNTEAIVVLRHSEKDSVAKCLGLDELAALPRIDADAWNSIRSRNEIFTEDVSSAKHIFLVAIETGSGFEIDSANKKINFSLGATLLGANDTVIAESKVIQIASGKFFIEVGDATIRGNVSRIEVETLEGERCLIYVHHTTQVARSFHRSKYTDIYEAIENFDTPLNEQLLKIVEKIIFDETDDYAGNFEASVSSSVSTGENFIADSKIDFRQDESPQENFSVSAAEIENKKRLATLRQDSLSELLTFINRRLYSPASKENQTADFSSEEEQVNSDDDEEDRENGESNKERQEAANRLAKTYRAKTKTMMARMSNRLKSVSDSEDPRQIFVAVRQLSAVLSFLRLVRDYEYSQPEPASDESFIDAVKEWIFFLDATAAFFFCRRKVFENQTVLPSSILSEELPSVIGHLIWLAWDCPFDIEMLEEKKKNLYSDTEDEDGWFLEDVIDGAACFLKFASVFSSDSKILSKAKEIFGIASDHFACEDEEMLQWFEHHQKWMEKISAAQENVQSLSTENRKPQIGDFVYLKKSSLPEIFIVSKDSSTNIHVIDFNSRNRVRQISSAKDFVAAINLFPEN